MPVEPSQTNHVAPSHPSNTADPDTASLEAVCVFSPEKLFPADKARELGLDPEGMAMLEVPNGSSSLYNALLQYAAHFAIDINTNFDTLPAETTVPKLQVTKKKKGIDKDTLLDKGFAAVSVPRREGAGHLSTLWNCPVDRYDPFSRSDSESDDSDAESEPDDSDAESDDGLKKKSSLLEGILHVPTLKKKPEPPVQRYQMGLGFAKLRLADEIIGLHHWGYGLPVSKSYSIQVFRTLILVGSNPQVLKEICAVAIKWRTDREQENIVARPGRFTLFRFKTNGHGCGDWSNEGYKRSRPPKSVILPQGQLESIVRDLKDFCGRDTKVWYEAHGLPHRRSFLFHGPAGCGKTSTIRMIAGMFRLNACFLSLTSNDFSNQVLQDALASIPRRALLVLEDVDVLFNEDRKSETGTALTFSGMLNALDGLVSVDGIMTIFTTNHIEKLDAALIRGGRVDRRFEFVHPSQKQMCALFLSFYEDAPYAVAERFATSVLNRPEEEARSIATLQQHFIFTRKKNAEECVNMLPAFFKEFYPKSGQNRNPLYI